MKNDTTKGTYTHKTLEVLLAEVNKIYYIKSRLIAGYSYDVSDDKHYTHNQPESS